MTPEQFIKRNKNGLIQADPTIKTPNFKPIREILSSLTTAPIKDMRPVKEDLSISVIWPTPWSLSIFAIFLSIISIILSMVR